MDLTFSNAGLADLCNSKQRMVKRWGREGFHRVGRRLLELSALEYPSELERLPSAVNVHDASGNVAIDFNHGDVVIQGVITSGKSRQDSPGLRVTSISVRCTSGVVRVQ